jgi:splicing factor, arginine/serine-rich 4/5/6
VFLGGITSNENDADIKEKFREYGRIVDIALKDGYGFIEFEDPRDAQDAIRDMHRRDIFGNGIVTV